MDLPSPLPTSGDFLARLMLQRAIAAVYLNAFLITLNQAPALIGERGLLPMRLLMPRINFVQSPSLFYWSQSDSVLKAAAWAGVCLAGLALSGISERFGLWLSLLTWGGLWLLYLSFVNAGQAFYGFGWETLLCEAGFLTIFLGPAELAPAAVVPWLFRWILFRLMFGAGMIKLRGDECWKDLTCMLYHYETQPLPDPFSRWFHAFPGWIHQGEVLVTHCVELVVPFFYFAPAPLCYVAGLLTIGFQLTLILSGNLSWLNYITIGVALSCFDDRFYRRLLPAFEPPAMRESWPWHQGVIGCLSLGLLGLSIRPFLNLWDKNQRMNSSYEPLHLVNTYGAFGSVTRTRYEVILEGSNDEPGPAAKWLPYEFKAKPGDPDRTPPWVSPYYFKLDWQMWFAAMSSYGSHPWIINLVGKLLRHEAQTLALLARSPFPQAAPKYIRAELYEYHFAPYAPWAEALDVDKGRVWWRQRTQSYLPPLSLDNESFRRVLHDQGWDD